MLRTSEKHDPATSRRGISVARLDMLEPRIACVADVARAMIDHDVEPGTQDARDLIAARDLLDRAHARIVTLQRRKGKTDG